MTYDRWEENNEMNNHILGGKTLQLPTTEKYILPLGGSSSFYQIYVRGGFHERLHPTCENEKDTTTGLSTNTGATGTCVSISLVLLYLTDHNGATYVPTVCTTQDVVVPGTVLLYRAVNTAAIEEIESFYSNAVVDT